MLRYQKEQLANRDFQLVHLLVPLLWPGAVLAGKISGAIAPRREEGEGDLGGSSQKIFLTMPFFRQEIAFFEHREWPLLHEEAL